ncbi:MAG: hypothetical protein ACE5LV_11110 [Candidatus Aminicenantales bacterium]
MKATTRCLRELTRTAKNLREIKKSDLRFGDLVIVTTRNSNYNLHVLGNGTYLVSGGWFAKNGRSPTRMGVVGCTWGGSIIKVDALAACGLRMEFANGVVTSPVREVRVVQGQTQN